MTAEQAKEAIRALEAEIENNGAIANAFTYNLVRFWYAYVAISPAEDFPAWPNTDEDNEENRAKWKRLREAWKTASDRNIKIRCELRTLRRIAGLSPII